LPQAEQAGLRAANFDGQVAFNVITQEMCSLDGAFVGYIGRDLTGAFVDGVHMFMVPDATGKNPLCRGQVTTIPVASKTAPDDLSVCGDKVAFDITTSTLPDWTKGSDLAPQGVWVGRKTTGVDSSARFLQFCQTDGDGAPRGVMKTEHYDVPSVTLTKSSFGYYYGGGTDTTVAVIPGWSKDWINAHTIEFWYKPTIPPAPPTGATTTTPPIQTLFHWIGGDPKKIDGDCPGFATAADPVKKAADQIPNVVGTGSGPIVWGAHAECKAWLEPIASLNPQDPPSYTVKCEFIVKANDNTETYPQQSNAFTGYYYGSYYYGSDMTQAYQIGTGTHTPAKDFDCTLYTLAGQAVRAGTWHHAVMGFHARQTYGGAPVAPGFGIWEPVTYTYSYSYGGVTYTYSYTYMTYVISNSPPDYVGPNNSDHHFRFYSDGVEILNKTATSSDPDASNPAGDEWPQQPDAQSQILANVLWEYAYVVGTTHYQLCSKAPDLMYPENPKWGKTAPVELVPGVDPIRFGKGYNADEMTPFNGIIDNIIFQGKWQEQADSAGVNKATGVQERFDTWRPQMDPFDVHPDNTKRASYADPTNVHKPMFKSAATGSMSTLESGATTGGSSSDLGGDQWDQQHLTFRKHTPALEWDHPIQIVSYEWTAWKDNPNPKYSATDPNASPYIDIGKC